MGDEQQTRGAPQSVGKLSVVERGQPCLPEARGEDHQCPLPTLLATFRERRKRLLLDRVGLRRLLELVGGIFADGHRTVLLASAFRVTIYPVGIEHTG